MPTAVHELFVARVEDAIYSQLKMIREGSGGSAELAKKIHPARSTEIHFPADSPTSNSTSRYEPDASFWHDDAEYPGVIIEVAYSQKKKQLGRLAEDYLLDSNANVQVVIGLDIEYSKKGSRKATLSVWRTELFQAEEGSELRATQETADEVCVGKRIVCGLTSNVLIRHFETRMETLRIMQASGFASAILLIRDWYRT